jgi:hypothetical protein
MFDNVASPVLGSRKMPPRRLSQIVKDIEETLLWLSDPSSDSYARQNLLKRLRVLLDEADGVLAAEQDSN